MSTRKRVKTEAEDFASRHYEDLHSHRTGAERGFIAGRTITAEQVEAAAKAMRNQITLNLEEAGVHLVTMSPNQMHDWRGLGREALEAAGLIEEDDDE